MRLADGGCIEFESRREVDHIYQIEQKGGRNYERKEKDF